MGDVTAFTRDQMPVEFKSRRSAELLAALAIDSGQPVTRTRLLDRLWPEKDELQGRRALNTELWRLRESLKTAGIEHSDWIMSSPDAIKFNTDDEGGPLTDVARLQTMANRLRMEQESDAPPVQKLREIIGLYKGDLALSISSEWIEDYRRRLRDVFLDLVARSIEVASEQTDNETAVEFAKLLVNLEPLQESANRRLMLLYVDRGDRARAVQHYLKFKSMLQDELGVIPSNETQRVYEEQCTDTFHADEAERSWSITSIDAETADDSMMEKLKALQALSAQLSTQLDDLVRYFSK